MRVEAHARRAVAARVPAGCDAGLTLVEVLVSLVIVGVLSGATALTLGPRGAGAAEGEARRLAARLGLGADTALVSGRPLMFVWDVNGYGFLDWGGTPSDWRPSTATRLARRDLAAGVTLAGEGRLVLDPGGTGAPGMWRIAAAGEVWAVSFDGVTPRVAPGAP